MPFFGRERDDDSAIEFWRIETRLMDRLETLRHEIERAFANGRKESTRIASVLLLGESVDGPIFGSWSWQLGLEERYRAQVRFPRAIQKGAWLVAMNGALISAVSVGVYSQSVYTCDGAPVVQIPDGIAIAMDLLFTVSFGPTTPR